MSETRRTRGRPRSDDAADRRAVLLDVARRHFAEKGFAGASLRGIAREAGVDASLVSHYFGDKQSLLVATLELPVDPAAKVAEVLDGPLEDLGERLVRMFVTTWDDHREAFATLVRTTLSGQDVAGTPVLQLVNAVVVDGLTQRLDGDRLRAATVASQVLGLGVARYVAQLEPLASADVEDVVALHGRAIQSVLSP